MPHRPYLPPIEREQLPYSIIRVACRLVLLDYHHRPQAYHQHPPSAVLALATRQRLLFPSLYPHLVFIAKALAQGMRLTEIRTCPVEAAPRSIAKRRVRRQ